MLYHKKILQMMNYCTLLVLVVQIACMFIAGDCHTEMSISIPRDKIDNEGLQANNDKVRMLKLGTYNVDMFLKFGRDSVTRLNRIIEQIPKDLDIIGIQEAWEPSSRQYLIQRLSSSYPYFHYPEDDIDRYYQCQNIEAASNFLSCINDKQTFPVKKFEDLQPCSTSLHNLLYSDLECFSCIISASFDKEDPSVCLKEPGWPLYAFHGSSGIILFSKIPLDEVHVKLFPGLSTRRAIQIAMVGNLSIAHSHFPFFDSGFPSLFPDQSHFASYIVSRGVSIVLGDFNSGPGYQHDLAYDIFIENGYIDISPQHDTFCPKDDGLSNNPDCDSRNPANIDHIFILGHNQAKTWKGSNAFNLLSFESSFFAAHKNQISDHIGLMSDICLSLIPH